MLALAAHGGAGQDDAVAVDAPASDDALDGFDEIELRVVERGAHETTLVVFETAEMPPGEAVRRLAERYTALILHPPRSLPRPHPRPVPPPVPSPPGAPPGAIRTDEPAVAVTAVRLGRALRARAQTLARRLAARELAVHAAVAALLGGRFTGDDRVAVRLDRSLVDAADGRLPVATGVGTVTLDFDLRDWRTGSDLVRRAETLLCTAASPLADPAVASTDADQPTLLLSLAQRLAPRLVEFIGLEARLPAADDGGVDVRLDWFPIASRRAEATPLERAEAFETLLDSLIEEGEAPLGLLEWLPSRQRALLEGWNGFSVASVAAGRRVDEIATRGSGPLSPAAIDRSAAHLAAAGVRPGQTVAVQVPVGAAMLAAHLAVFRSGAACLPIDLSRDHGDRAARLDRGAADWLWHGDDDPSSWRLEARARSTGRSAVAPVAYALVDDRPMVAACTRRSHRAVIDSMLAFVERIDLRSTDRLLLVSVTAEEALLEQLAACAVGAEIARIGAIDARGLDSIAEKAAAIDPTVVVASAQGWRRLRLAGWRPSAGARAWIEDSQIDGVLARYLRHTFDEAWSFHGHPAAGHWSVANRLLDPDPRLSAPPDEAAAPDRGCWWPIGKVMAGRSAWILDAHARLCPFGVEGDLWYGGAGVDTELDAVGATGQAMFRPDCFAAEYGRRIVRAGIRARIRSTGVVERRGEVDALQPTRLDVLDRREEPEPEALTTGDGGAAGLARGLLRPVVIEPMSRAHQLEAAGHALRTAMYADDEGNALARRRTPEVAHLHALPAWRPSRFRRQPNGHSWRRRLGLGALAAFLAGWAGSLGPEYGERASRKADPLVSGTVAAGVPVRGY